jgi:hypothetical protein
LVEIEAEPGTSSEISKGFHIRYLLGRSDFIGSGIPMGFFNRASSSEYHWEFTSDIEPGNISTG